MVKISSVETFCDEHVRFTRVTAEDGATGWGQCSTFNAGKYFEFSIEGDGYCPWPRRVFRGDPFAVRNGKVRIPDGPGWGGAIRHGSTGRNTKRAPK
ncbi:MAG: hypothetical protein B7Z02_00255 [Rhodobacterales bacterium 32-67-9]|nr:MAG: hypothetical protein B7Z02_00255 [Rhodobacterales bacterium 32-67-9]